MQKLDMSSYGVEELDVNEMKNLDGGCVTLVGFIPVMIPIIIGIKLLAGVIVSATTVIGGLGAIGTAMSGIIIAY